MKKIILAVGASVGVFLLAFFVNISSQFIGTDENSSNLIEFGFYLLGISYTVAIIALINKYILKDKLPSLFKSPNNISAKQIILWIFISFIIIFSTLLIYYIFGYGDFILYKNTTFIQAFIAALGLAVFAGFTEELCFRYLFYGYLKTITSKKIAIIICGLAFGAVHAHLASDTMGALAIMISAFLVTTMFIAIYELSGSIWPAAIAHSIWDMFTLQRGFIYTNIYNDKINTYGEGALDAYVGFHVSETNPIISGGSFGVEQGLIAGIVYVLVALICFYFYKKKKS